jgi:hypothetical protein
MIPKRTALTLALILLSAGSAVAQDPNTAIAAILDTALAEQQVFLTCTATSLKTHVFLRDAWARDVADGLQILADAGYPTDRIDAFTIAAMPENIILPATTPFGEVVAFCDANQGFERGVTTLTYTILRHALPKVIPE